MIAFETMTANIWIALLAFGCFMLFNHLITCDWHRLVDSNVWMTAHFWRLFSKFFFNIKLEKKTFFIFVVNVPFSSCFSYSFFFAVDSSKLWINNQKLYLHVVARIHFHQATKKSKMIKSKSHFSNMILTFPLLKLESLRFLFKSIIRLQWHKARTNGDDEKKIQESFAIHYFV